MYYLRHATMFDLDLLLQWRNDPDTRANSHNHDPVTADEHRRWITQSFVNPDRCLYILHDETGQAFGTGRVDRHTDGEGEISVTVAPEHRGQGIGTQLIQETTQVGAMHLGVTRVRAEILAHNIASLRAFEKAGYRDAEMADGVVTVWFAFSAPS